MIRRLLIGFGAAAVALTWLAACAPDTRYRVLSFFFDGVPEPGAPPKRVQTGPGLLVAAPPPRKQVVVYRHPPYVDNKCRECHDPFGSWLTRTPEEGLCQRCHPGVPGPWPYLHGPAAANACLSCHHHHESLHRWLLLVDPKDLCYRCHKQSDLTTGPHHAELAERPCLECHNPHGGADRYFLRPPEERPGAEAAEDAEDLQSPL